MNRHPSIPDPAVDMIRQVAELFDTERQAVIGTRLSGEIVYWNRAAERLYGWSTDEVRGRSIVDVTPSRPSREQARAIMSRLQMGHSWAGAFRVRDRGGAEFRAQVRDVPVLDARGDLVGIVGVSTRDETP
jgi:PAS domain S-box-containing protein